MREIESRDAATFWMIDTRACGACGRNRIATFFFNSRYFFNSGSIAFFLVVHAPPGPPSKSAIAYFHGKLVLDMAPPRLRGSHHVMWHHLRRRLAPPILRARIRTSGKPRHHRPCSPLGFRPQLQQQQGRGGRVVGDARGWVELAQINLTFPRAARVLQVTFCPAIELIYL